MSLAADLKFVAAREETIPKILLDNKPQILLFW